MHRRRWPLFLQTVVMQSMSPICLVLQTAVLHFFWEIGEQAENMFKLMLSTKKKLVGRNGAVCQSLCDLIKVVGIFIGVLMLVEFGLIIARALTIVVLFSLLFPDMPCMKRVYRDKTASFHWSAARNKERVSSRVNQ